jgi:hypothetical protein
MTIQRSNKDGTRRGLHQIHFRLSERDYQDLNQIAELQGEHVATLMRRLVRMYVRQWRQTAPSQVEGGRQDL